MWLSFSLELWRRDVEKGACIGAMANGIATERRCVVGSMLSHFLPVVYWLGCIIIHFIHLLHCPSPAFCALLGWEWWCGVLLIKYIKDKAKGCFCTCFAPYSVRILSPLLSKNNRFALPFFSVRDRGAIKKSNKNFVISQKMYYLCSALSPDGGIGRRAGLKHQWSNPSRFDPGSGYKSLNVKPCKLNICRAFLLLMCSKDVLNRQQIAKR